MSGVSNTGFHVVCFVETEDCEGFGDCCSWVVSRGLERRKKGGGLTVSSSTAEAENEAAHGDFSFAILVCGAWLGLHVWDR